MVMAAACFALSVFLVTYALLLRFLQSRQVVQSRLLQVQKSNSAGIAVPSQAVKSAKQKVKIQWLIRMDTLLRHAEVDIPVKDFVARWFLIVLCVAMGMFLVAGIGGAILGIGLGGGGVLLYLRARGQLRDRKFNDGLHDVLMMLSNSLHAGHSFVQSIQLVAQDSHGPIKEEFERLIAEMQMGVGIEEALLRSGERVKSEDYDLIITAISIQRQVGGNLAEVLESIAQTIRDRVKLKREVKALTSQGRLSALIFMVMPAGVGGILFLINPSYISVLFHSTIGIAMLIFAVLGQGIGYLIIRKIIKIDL